MISRDPTNDLIQHIVTGEKPPLSGDPTIRQYDAELDRMDPMAPFTAGAGINGPNNLTVHQSADTNLVTGWDTGNSGALNEEPAKEPVDMSVASNCFDSPEKGQLGYGPKNTGDGGY
jgi:hypothetical protein